MIISDQKWIHLLHVLDAATLVCHEFTKLCQAARSIRYCDKHLNQATVDDQSSFQNSAKHCCVNVSATKRYNHFFTFQLRHETLQNSRESDRSGSFNNSFF